ncbi:thiolase domain-containing protein [candidate division KSB1 bacterium]|nr:thiolase domain-containing protein [candidate division KSB1 bacterium]
MREVAIIGLGIHKWGEHWDRSLSDMFIDVALKAMADAEIDKIDSMCVGCMTSGLFVGQEHIAVQLADYLGIKHLPATRVETACASGALAFRTGLAEVMSGLSDIVLVGGVEKMTDVSVEDATFALSTAADQDYEGYHGITFPALCAMMARSHMNRYGSTSEQLASVAVKNHFNGALNPNAQYQSQITIENVMNSTIIADPLHMLDCSPITDGAAAVIICSMETARKISKKPIVKVTGWGHATDTLALHNREDFTTLKSTELAAQQAFKIAGIGPRDIDVAEIHDGFSIMEVIATEAIGFFEKGQGGFAAEQGRTALNGELPVNTSGGLKSRGHPAGATGVAQIVEIGYQLRGDAGKRQVQNARIGLTQNIGGIGGSSLIHIMEAV